MVRGECVRLRPRRDARGGEQKGARYGVIVQSDLIGLTSTVLVVPTSTKSQPATFRPRINLPDGPTYALTEQTRAIDRAAVGPSVGRLEAHEMLAVDRALKLTFGLVSYLA